MRQYPVFDLEKDSSSKQNAKSNSWSCLWWLLIIIGSYFVFAAIQRAQTSSGTILDQVICYGTLAFVIYAVVSAFLEETGASPRAIKAKKQWKETCLSAEVTITSRHHKAAYTSEINEYGDTRYNHAKWFLILRLPDQTEVSARVSETLYKSLEGKTLVRIYYKPESPLAFMIEGEI